MITVLHIVFGSGALAAGAAALSARKGSRLHASAGSLFFAAMLGMTGSGATMALLRGERGTALIGVFTAYLVVTAWAAARRRDGRAGGLEQAALLVGTACAAGFIAFSIMAASSADGRLDSLPAAAHYPFAALAVLAASLDLRFVLRGRMTPPQRLTRHLWRMCAAFLIAAFSFFLGQQKVMPEWIQGSPFLFLPEIAIFATMTWWLVRLRRGKRSPNLPALQRGEAAAGAG